MKSDRTMTEDEARKFFAEFYRGEHHIPGRKMEPWGTGFAVTHHGDLSTWDFNELTRLVVMAHQEAIRVTIVPWHNKTVKIAIHPRPRGFGANDHPGIGEHIIRINSGRKKWIEDHGPIRSEFEARSDPGGGAT